MRVVLIFLIFCNLLLTASFSAVTKSKNELFPLALIHINDFHARFEETNEDSNTCKSTDTCVGGYARVVTTVKQLKEKHKDKNPIYLNAGDNFQGTFWYKILRWNVTSHFLNLLPADVMTIGNHEFDHGVEGLVPFLKTINSPIVVANIDDSQEPSMQGLYKNSIVIEKGGRKIGIIGVIAEETSTLTTSVGNLKFTNEAAAVRAEALKLHDAGVNIIIVLSHSGFSRDKIIAKDGGPHIDVVVGGHSHTLLYTGDTAPGPDPVEDKYPTIVEQNDGRKVYVVQAGCYSKYVGDLQVWFDQDGNIQELDGNPIYMSSDIKPDSEILNELIVWKKGIIDLAKVVYGETKQKLERTPCNDQECTLGNLIADAFKYSLSRTAEEQGVEKPQIGMVTFGRIRTSFDIGELTYEDIAAVMPFGIKLTSFKIQGDKLLAALEHAASGSGLYRREMLHFSGLKVTYNMSNPIGERVLKVEVVCDDCSEITYKNLDKDSYYRVGTTYVISNGTDRIDGIGDTEALAEYIKHKSPLNLSLEGRITLNLSKSGKLKFLSAVETVKNESEALHQQGVDIIIVLSHCGLGTEKLIARDGGPHVDLIVGSHSHTFLYSGDNPPGPAKPEGPYPVVVEQADGRKVYIVQAFQNAFYVGEWLVWFDEDGNVTRYEGNPVFLSHDVIPDPEILNTLEHWAEDLGEFRKTVYGTALGTFELDSCKDRECALGNLVADAYIHAFKDKKENDDWAYAAISIVNYGSIRTSLSMGNVTVDDIESVVPFENQLNVAEISGDKLKEAFENSVIKSVKYPKKFFHVSGLKIVYDTSKPDGNKIKSIEVRCQACPTPVYEPLDPEKIYRVIGSVYFLQGEGDGYTTFKKYGKVIAVGPAEFEAFQKYIKDAVVIEPKLEGRLVFE